MKKTLKDRLFGTRKNNGDVDTAASKKEKALASVNESDATSTKSRTRRTVGLTEQRLRARNKQSWMTSTKGWSELFGRFMASAKG